MHSAHQRHRAGVGHVGLVGGDGLLAYLQVHVHELVRERGELIAEAHLQTKKILMFLSQNILPKIFQNISMYTSLCENVENSLLKHICKKKKGFYHRSQKKGKQKVTPHRYKIKHHYISTNCHNILPEIYQNISIYTSLCENVENSLLKHTCNYYFQKIIFYKSTRKKIIYCCPSKKSILSSLIYKK